MWRNTGADSDPSSWRFTVRSCKLECITAMNHCPHRDIANRRRRRSAIASMCALRASLWHSSSAEPQLTNNGRTVDESDTLCRCVRMGLPAELQSWLQLNSEQRTAMSQWRQDTTEQRTAKNAVSPVSRRSTRGCVRPGCATQIIH